MATQTPITNHDQKDQPRDLRDLSFVASYRRLGKPNKDDGISKNVCFWNVPKPTGDYYLDLSIGYELALEFFEYTRTYERIQACRDDLVLIIEDMPRVTTGIERAFLATVMGMALETAEAVSGHKLRACINGQAEQCRKAAAEAAEEERKEKLFKKLCRTQMKLRRLKASTIPAPCRMP